MAKYFRKWNSETRNIKPHHRTEQTAFFRVAANSFTLYEKTRFRFELIKIINKYEEPATAKDIVVVLNQVVNRLSNIDSKQFEIEGPLISTTSNPGKIFATRMLIFNRTNMSVGDTEYTDRIFRSLA
jgi:hypothetical protein